jgi:peroxidase
MGRTKREVRSELAVVAVLAAAVMACGEFRAIDGDGNNSFFPELGAAGTPLARSMDTDYGDGISSMAGGERPSPREISNTVCAQSGSIPNAAGASDMLWQWGQFVDHDIDLTPEAEPSESAPIPVPTGDPFFDPLSTGTAVIGLNRSSYDPDSGYAGHPRQQMNHITAWIDASNVYGSDDDRASALRKRNGRMRTSSGDLLPFNTAGFPNAGGNAPSLFLAGDVRANEQAALTAMHTLFMREHNFWADQIATWFPEAGGDLVYQLARLIVGAEVQVITYKEFLPALLGRDAISPYEGYDPAVDASIGNEFSTAAYRFGHSMLSPTLLRLDESLEEVPEGHLALRDAFFAPQRITDEGGIAPLLRGLTQQQAEEVDPFVVDDVRNFLFGPPGSGGFDLAALNIQRGRDHGLPSYNEARVARGLAAVTSFEEISSDPEIQTRLEAAYGDVDQIDMWVGGLAEDHVPGALVGPLVYSILVDQFERLRDGDRLWYRRTLGPTMTDLVEGMRLSDIIRRNTEIGFEIPDDVFHVPSS